MLSPPVPTALLAALRSLHRRDPQLLDHEGLTRLGLQRLPGGRNNRVFAWDSPDGPACVKLYRTDRRDRATAEFAALSHLVSHGHTIAPRPLWHAADDHLPAIAMTLMPGTSLPALDRPAAALPAIAHIHTVIRGLPLGPFARTARVGAAASVLHRIGRWSTELGREADDSLSSDLQRLLAAWLIRRDADVLAEAAPAVLSRGESNLDNWHHHDAALHVLDWEFTGTSDTAFDTADLVEHLSARAIDDHDWATYLPALGIGTPAARRRFRSAQRTIALRWLAVLWNHRDTRSAEVEYQAMRVRDLFGSDFI